MGVIIDRIEDSIRHLEKIDVHNNVKILSVINNLIWIMEADEDLWILCSERMPDGLQGVICCNNKGSIEVGCLRYSSPRVIVCKKNGRTILKNIIAWMPLPDFPEEIIKLLNNENRSYLCGKIKISKQNMKMED